MEKHDRQEMVGVIDEYLTYMELSERNDRAMRGAPPAQRFSPTILRHAEPMVAGSFLKKTEALTDSERVYYMDEPNPQKWVMPLNLTIITVVNHAETDRIKTPGKFALRNFRSAQPHETRGAIKPWVPHVVFERNCIMYEDGTYATAVVPWGWVGGTWQQVDPRWRIDNASFAIVDQTLSMIHEHQVYRTMLWHVSFRYLGTKASVLVPCDASAALELFKNRELPPSARRRASLLHWVDEHWRRKPSDPEDAVRVIKHLRGRESFTWTDGLQVEVHPSVEDLKKVAPDSTYARKHLVRGAAS